MIGERRAVRRDGGEGGEEIEQKGHLCLVLVEVFACGCDESSKALQALFIRGRTKETNNALMHDRF